jgi:hypothetical protein
MIMKFIQCASVQGRVVALEFVLVRLAGTGENRGNKEESGKGE